MSNINPDAYQYEPKPREYPSVPALNKPSRPAKPGENHIRQAFIGVNMAYQHDSLRLVCEEGGLDIDNLGRGDFVLFVNAKWTRMKLLAMGEVILYLRAPGQNQINPDFLEALPRIFNSAAPMTYDIAVRQLFERFVVPQRKTTRNVQTGRRHQDYGERQPAVNEEEQTQKGPEVVIVRKKKF